MREEQVIAKARGVLEAKGCLVVKTHGNGYFPIGFPDLIIVRPDGVTAFVEAKSPSEKPTDIQLKWIHRLGEQKVPVGWSDNAQGIVEIVFKDYVEPIS